MTSGGLLNASQNTPVTEERFLPPSAYQEAPSSSEACWPTAAHWNLPWTSPEEVQAVSSRQCESTNATVSGAGEKPGPRSSSFSVLSTMCFRKSPISVFASLFELDKLTGTFRGLLGLANLTARDLKPGSNSQQKRCVLKSKMR